jgi:hypothetical protein
MIVWPVGDSHTQVPLTLLTTSNTPVVLQPTDTFQVRVRTQSPQSFYINLSATVTLLNLALGQILVQFAPNDVARSGVFRYVIQGNSGGELWSTFEQDLVIVGSP